MAGIAAHLIPRSNAPSHIVGCNPLPPTQVSPGMDLTPVPQNNNRYAHQPAWPGCPRERRLQQVGSTEKNRLAQPPHDFAAEFLSTQALCGPQRCLQVAFRPRDIHLSRQGDVTGLSNLTGVNR